MYSPWEERYQSMLVNFAPWGQAPSAFASQAAGDIVTTEAADQPLADEISMLVKGGMHEIRIASPYRRIRHDPDRIGRSQR
jgi:hypothetical protein